MSFSKTLITTITDSLKYIFSDQRGSLLTISYNARNGNQNLIHNPSNMTEKITGLMRQRNAVKNLEIWNFHFDGKLLKVGLDTSRPVSRK